MICFSLLGGIGSALPLSPSIAIIGHYFSHRRGHATSIATTGGLFGDTLSPLIT
jgi:MFS family permease